jgi:NAD(P)-dependent dehydrogenase (short-subunit alcohol dehydrogenase family)
VGRLDGKVALITGGARGQGEAEVRLFAAEGARVVISDVLTDQGTVLADELGDAVAFTRHDVSSEEEWDSAVRFVKERFGRLDVLVNNAGIAFGAPIDKHTVADVERLFSVNQLGVFLGLRAAIAPMTDVGGGSIVNISSGASLGQSTLATYAASKGAVASLTYSWALDLEPAGIRVNAVCPLAHTRMVRASERARRKCPPDRTPDRVAPLVVFLISDRSQGITGQMVRCTGPELHIIGQPYLKAPILARDQWDTETIERAFTEVFQAHLEPYGLEKRLPPLLRTWLTPATA